MARSLRVSAFTLALSYVALSALVLALFATPLWYEWRATMTDARAEVLHEDVRRLTEVFERHGLEGLKDAIEGQVGGRVSGGRIMLLTDGAYAPLAGNISAWPKEMPTFEGTFLLPIDVGDRSVRAAITQATLPGGYNLLVGRDTARYARLEGFFWRSLALAFGTILLMGVVVGVLIRRSLLAEVQDVSRTASAIVAGDLSQRLASRGGDDELAMLAQTLNAMLDQIEKLVQGVREVSNAIAHDLRTPLAELRSRLEELTLTRPAPAVTFAEIDAAVADVDRVIALFNALLRLAEIDTGARRSGFVAVDVAKVAADAAEFYQPFAELKGVSLSFASSGELPVAGDPLLLAQAIGNLIDNSIKFAPPDGVITVAAGRRPGGPIEITVADDGPGIADGEKPKVVERFYRGDASRGTPGVGLGLALVAAVARLHGGLLELTDNRPGLRASLIF